MKGRRPPLTLVSHRLTFEIPENFISDHFIVNMSNQLIAHSAKSGVQSKVDEFARPWRTETQFSHVAALAYVGDFVTLIEYQEAFKKGQNCGFYPAIDENIINRALDIALERG